MPKYLDLLSSLYADKPVLVKPKTKSLIPSEDDEQMILATYLTKKSILFYHCPNGGYRRQAEAFKFKRMGVQPGVPDICIPMARKGHHGLYIELKRRDGGVVSSNQQYWLAQLTKQGYLAVVCEGADSAIKLINNYFGV